MIEELDHAVIDGEFFDNGYLRAVLRNRRRHRCRRLEFPVGGTVGIFFQEQSNLREIHRRKHKPPVEDFAKVDLSVEQSNLSHLRVLAPGGVFESYLAGADSCDPAEVDI